MPDLMTQTLPVAALRPYPRNARSHSKKQIRQIADSITRFGFTNPVLIDGEGMIIVGHGRVEAAKLLGMTEVPCVRLEHMNEADKRAYIIADNKLALNAGWDEDLLASELQFLLQDIPDFDIGITGFTIAEVDSLIEGAKPEEAGDPADDVLPDIVGPARCQAGDLWQLGAHRLYCGSSLDALSFAAVLGSERAQMIFTDPPYNVRIDGHVGGSGKIKHREFAMAAGEMTEDEFVAFLRTVLELCARHSQDGSIHFVCMDWRHMRELQAAGEAVYDELKNLIVWVKDNGGMGTFYRSRHELICVYKAGTAPHINSFELGQHGRYRTNVWQYRGVNGFGANRKDLEIHPTAKPVAMIVDAIRDVSARGGIVLDPFGGSGSTLIAAHKTGRRGYLIELDPVYCDRIITRFERLAKDEAVQLACGWPRQVQANTAPAQAA